MSQLREIAPLRWSLPENLHITTKFIGEWPEARLPEVEAALAEMPKPRPFALTLARFGFLPNPDRPKIFFAGVYGDAGLHELAKNTEDSLATLGIKKETHPYTPHVTLARVPWGRASALRAELPLGVNPELGTFKVTEFHLYQSKNSQYTPLATYPLAKETS